MFQNNRTFSAEALKEAEGGEIPAFSVTVETGEKIQKDKALLIPGDYNQPAEYLPEKGSSNIHSHR